jgi:hypothetical protein
MLMRGRRRRRTGCPGGKARGGGRAPGVGEDGAEQEDGEEEPRRPGQVGGEASRFPGVDGGGPAAWRGARASAGRWTADSGRPAAVENLGGVDVKCALNANHTASRTKLALHAQRASDVPVNFS